MPPDSKFRRIVFDLATMPSQDQDAILKTLTEAERKRVETLLLDYSDHARSLTAGPRLPSFDDSRISPWLCDRLRADREGVVLTSAARETLTACAVQLFPRSSSGHRVGFVTKTLLRLRGPREAHE